MRGRTHAGPTQPLRRNDAPGDLTRAALRLR